MLDVNAILSDKLPFLISRGVEKREAALKL